MAASEECDVNVIENWEQIDESELLAANLLRLDPPSPEETEIMSGGSVSGPIVFPDNYGIQYGPPEPTVKILKRPPKNGPGTNQDSPVLNGDLRPKQPVKTLQQREQEYAEARLRILGEARSPEEQQETVLNDRICKIQPKMEILKLSDNANNVIRYPKGPDGTKGFTQRR